jgi:mannosyltransferase OCH1-like enzyme
MVPKLIHRVAIGTVPEAYETYWQKWQTLHPGWQFKTWTDPDPALYPNLGVFFELASCESQLSDFMRWEIVYNEGGVYTDWDVEPYRPFDTWLEHDFFIGTEDGNTYSPGLFGAARAHPAVKAMIDAYHKTDKYGNRQWGTNPSTTGPQIVSRTLQWQSGVHLVPKQLFYPYHYSEADPGTYGDAYSAHHWGHSWKGVQ